VGAPLARGLWVAGVARFGGALCLLGSAHSADTCPELIVSSFYRQVSRLKQFLTIDLPGGPRFLKAAWVINLQKGGTLPFVLMLMWVYDEWGITATTYAALHGSYGLVWLLKDRLFPDPGWEVKITLGAAFFYWAGALGLYWIAPWLITSQHIEAPTWLIGLAILTYALGVVIMVGADAQKFFVLKVKRGLITDGWFSRIRHPNYLGEMMLYASFAMLAMHWAPWAVLAWVWGFIFMSNMLGKEASMSRYDEWAAYKARTGFLLPKLFPPKQ
jgi:protein-S-isoprenylcysteine O-methyltransferase Ste14